MKQEKMKIISPIAIDMGAKNTGVYYAKYENGSSFEQIEKHGQVLVYDKYTPLLKDRTANRHARRGYQRSKLAKRLLVLILDNYFDFPAKQHTQAIGFLLNRRGFTFLDEAYSKEHLESIPDEVWCELSDDVKDILESKESIVSKIEEFINNDPEKITIIFNAIQEIDGYKSFHKEEERISKEFIYFDYIEKINKACDILLKNEVVTDEKVAKKEGDKQKLSQTSNWIVERLNREQGLSLDVDNKSYQTDLAKQSTSFNAQQLQQRLPDVEEARKLIKNEQTENNRSPWKFTITKFEFNDKNETGLSELDTRIHLHHFCYAIHKINNEIVSGSRHRSKYFEEIKVDLENFTSDAFLSDKHSPKYLKVFAKTLNDNNYKLDKDKLWKLICHISNLELKPLRAYFNDKTPIKRNKDYKDDNQDKSNFISHASKDGGDKYSLEKLSRLVSVWFLKNWRVNEEKDNKEKVDDYTELRDLWKNHNDKNDVVKFWAETDPKLTIPPYQSMNNRKPPKCQTLLLNEDYLNDHYPDWKTWLNKLEPDTGYEEKLQSLLSGKRGRLVDDKKIALRQLQLILDTAKKRDKHKLNEIWSIYHQWQKTKTGDEKELKDTVSDSKLPATLKADLTFKKFQIAGSFGHFINKYYKTRRKAKDGRYFLIQEKKEKWLTDGWLLTLCTHKPRQKKHQWNIDLSAVLGIDSEILKQKIGCKLEDADAFFNKEFSNNYKINDFQSACDKTAKAQKDYRGSLKTKIDLAQKPKEEYKDKLSEKEQKGLSGLASKCEELSLQLAGKLWQDLSDDERRKRADKFKSVFSFAQINNIVFKDRNGFSKTCPVCSTDNAFRMQENDQSIAKASRLPAMSIRLIDGLVMRICDTVSRQVAAARWISIKDDLDSGKDVSIPLIFEQNRFEFEPSLKVIKNKLKEKGKKDSKESLVKESEEERGKEFSDKETRIKDSAQGICAYDGTPLGKGGERDHIIPQASIHGTLNDEANLIYVSRLANQNRSNQAYYLNNLHVKYKNKIFDCKTDDEIKQFIWQQLEGKDATIDEVTEGDNFDFGRYLSFINLTDDQQKAFRHSLFLSDKDPLKQKVIRALQNRNRTIVNGTQRYMAQCIADKIYKAAKKVGKEKQIEFDYFEYTARADDPKSTYNLRKLYGIDKPKKQPLYSHLIDAQMAFLIASEDHKNDGSMGIKFEENQTIWREQINKTTGIGEGNFLEVNLSRKKSETGVRLHRPFHRRSFYSENYVPLFIGKRGADIEVKAGFSWENSAKVKTNKENIFNLLKFAQNESISKWERTNKTLKDLSDCFSKKIWCGDFEVFYIDWNKTKIQKYLVDEFSNERISNGIIWSDEIIFLRKLSYRTRKKQINTRSDLVDVFDDQKSIIKNSCEKYNPNFEIKMFSKYIAIPAKKEWELLSSAWEKEEKAGKGEPKNNDNDFLKKYFSHVNSQKNNHQKVRKVFSLPVIDTGGNFIQKRNSWNDRDIYQIVADSDSRKDGNKFSRLVMMSDGKLKEVTNKPFISKNIFKLKKEILEVNENYCNINPNKWYEIDRENDDFPSGVKKIEYCVDNKTSPKIRIYLKECFTKNSVEKILQNQLTRPKENDKLRKRLTSNNIPSFLEYAASGFNAPIKKYLLKAMKE